MLFRIFLVITVVNTGFLLAQTKISNPERETFNTVQQKGDEKTSKSTSASARAILQNIVTMEKNIANKVADLEKLQAEAMDINKSMQKEIFIISENSTIPVPGPNKFLISRHVEYSFEGGNKIKEVRVVSRLKSLTNDMNSVIKVVSFTPGNVDSIRITIDKLETRARGASEVENYKDFAPEVKLLALKTIDTTLLQSIYRLDSFIQKNQISKIEKNKNQLEGL